jgi:hypothetical protein
MGKGKKVIGSKARLLGAVCLAPMPLSMIAGTAIGFLNPDAVVAGATRDCSGSAADGLKRTKAKPAKNDHPRPLSVKDKKLLARVAGYYQHSFEQDCRAWAI